ncbi:phage integrase SAM-like domain-containing protein [Bacteroides sp. 224]|uniref:phage integrase SAM-like domain-containing protein n=1 Tax=Bacteroides sp. 224 TaxID=2302936 RepID=UPI0013D71985|nr:tyrosine-type recombinase/integrase [Bacteroides sp. 224]NDV66136.1 hypothetical protein [Bacteroides sp. 224]
MKLQKFVRPLILSLRRESRSGTAKAYKSTLQSILLYAGKDVELEIILTKEWLVGYEQWLISRRRLRNTVSFYMRMLQSIYHQSVELNLIEHIPRLFAHVFTGYDPTEKRALSADVISRICQGELSGKKGLEFSRDMFMLSFYLHGISFVDMAYLRKTDWKGDSITYYRRKSKSYIHTPICKEARLLFKKYESLVSVDSPYLLPIITRTEKDDYEQYQTALRNQNRRLKRIALALGIEENLTTYVSRHSWATIAHHEGVPTPHISQALGHQTETVTRVYLANFDDDVLRDANELVLLAIKGGGGRSKKENVRYYNSDGHFLSANIKV